MSIVQNSIQVGTSYQVESITHNQSIGYVDEEMSNLEFFCKH